MIYPFNDDEEISVSEDQFTVPKEYEIDFNTGQLTGRIVEGNDAIAVWVWLALQTPRYDHYIYSWDYGQEFEQIIGKGYSKAYTDSELEAMIGSCLSVNPYIEQIKEFESESNGDELIASFKIETTFGEVNVDVRGNDIRVFDV